MKFLIRFITRSDSGSVEYRDKVFSEDTITFGRATDQTVHLRDRRVGLQHARVVRKGRRFYITTKSAVGITVNDKSCRDACIGTGDEIRMGANILRVIDPPEGFDLALTFELDSAAAAEPALEQQFRMSLSDTRLNKRTWSWALVTIVLTVFFIVPLFTAFGDKSTASMEESLPRAWIQNLLPDSRLWKSGPLNAAHRSQVGDNCNACHAEPFARVNDQQCVSCHAVAHHVDTQSFDLPELENRRCGSCHKEHNGPDWIVRRDPGMCSGCHGDLRARIAANVELADASDFTSDHPGFRVSIVDSEQHDSRIRIRLDSPTLSDPSGLTFPHDVHLDPGGIKAPDGEIVMFCSDCHKPQPGGALMEPIVMEQHCETCHRLTFDPSSPDRIVPHGDPAIVIRMLEEYYSYRFLTQSEGSTVAPASSGPRRPGRSITREQQLQAVGRARDAAQATSRELFERQACANCHQIELKVGPTGEPQWQVRQVILTGRWLPKANFDHSKHQTRGMPCDLCHAAISSTASTDVLIPDINTCRDCHGGTGARGELLASSCVDCHQFHLERHGPMRPELIDKTISTALQTQRHKE